MTIPDQYDSDHPEEVMWEGRFVTAKRRGRWEFASRSRGIRAAVILAIDSSDGEEDHVILVDQYRVPVGKRCLELPAGLVGDLEEAPDEETAVAAARELEEETGYRAGRMESAGEYYSSSGMLSESFTLFIARELQKVSDGGGVESEDIVVHRVPLSRVSDEIAAWRDKGHGVDVKLLALLGPRLLG